MDVSTPTSSTPVSARARSMRALRSATRVKAPRKPCTCSGLPLGRNGATNGRKPIARIRSSTASTTCVSYQLVNASWTSTTLRARSSADSADRACGVASAIPRAASSRRMEMTREFRRVHEPKRPHRRAARRAVQPQIVGAPRLADGRQHRLQRADQVVATGPEIAAVVEFEEFGPEGRDVHLDRALPGAGFARETAVHRVLDGVGEVRLAPLARPRVAQPLLHRSASLGAGAARRLSAAGSKPSAASCRSHSRVSEARPLGECLRSRVALYEGHIASSGSQVKQAPLPLQCNASSYAARTGGGMVRSSWPLVVSPSIRSSSPSSGVAILPGLSWLRGSKAALIDCSVG